MVNGINYDKVKVTYDPAMTGKTMNDMYILYINPTTKLIDQFFFSLPVAGVEQPVILMKLEYSKVKGLNLPLKRYIYAPGADGKPQAEAGTIQTITNLKFKNGFQISDFELK